MPGETIDCPGVFLSFRPPSLFSPFLRLPCHHLASLAPSVQPRTFLYAVAVVSAKIALALYARTSWFSAITLGVVLGPYLDAMILVLMHEVSLSLMTIPTNRPQTAVTFQSQG